MEEMPRYPRARKRSAAPLRSRFDLVGGVRVHARAGGGGPPVVLVHGYGVSGRYMVPLARELARDCAVFVPDLPGHGRSETPAEAQTIETLADALGEWLEVVGVERAQLVGNSMGCQVITELAVRRPELVGSLVLVGPTVDPAKRGARHQVFGALRDSRNEPALLVALAAKDGAGWSFRRLLATARSVLADRMEDRLPSIECPAVVVHGEKDGLVSHEWAERVAGLLPHGRLVVLPGEPHAIPYTQPALLGAIVRELLAEEGEDGVGELARRLPHRHVAAGDEHEPGARQETLPLRGHPRGYQPIVLTPDQ